MGEGVSPGAQGSPRLTWGSPNGDERRRSTLIRQNGKGNIWSTWFEFCRPLEHSEDLQAILKGLKYTNFDFNLTS
jgi:hypothetical protein